MRQRIALATLVVFANQTVLSDRLVEAIWPDRPPAASNNLHVHIYQLRQWLRRLDADVPDDLLQTRPGGYLLKTLPGERDVDRFDQLLASARQRAEVDPLEAVKFYQRALDVWRGPALADVVGHTTALTGEAICLEERRLRALEELIDIELRRGRHAELLPELLALASAHPLRETLCGQLMTALYRAGRRAEAVSVYIDMKKILMEDMGLEPSPALRRLYYQILNEDAALAGAPAGGYRACQLPE
ncbi:AfsR/SARP family transcriptional regulator [Allorhizocola rhizosphaerae]|uniref:AfsR/SARP family transcriptional regulator n=1 Tax=Allorhizocola rhizosphaerae TaxID=1872709 RepID=UPI0013C34A23|nr:AfsR/SARP family transcriptional regulator [Allorhizocola rhizosphaerae]